MIELDARGFFVYFLWGEQPDDLLYVGKSTNILARLGDHLRNKHRRKLVHRVSLLRCASGRCARRRPG